MQKIEYPSISIPSDGWLIVKDESGNASMMHRAKANSKISITFIENAPYYANADSVLFADKILKAKEL